MAKVDTVVRGGTRMRRGPARQCGVEPGVMGAMRLFAACQRAPSVPPGH